MVRVPADAARQDGAARKVGEHAAFDFDRTRAETHAGGVRIGVVADTQCDLTEMREDILIEDDPFGGRDLHGGRHLRPVIAPRFEFEAAPHAAQMRVARPRGGNAP